MKLTQTVAEALEPRARAYVVYDAPPGFGCRITPAGARAWVFEYRAGGGRGSASRRMTLGRIEALPYAKAKKAAEALYHRTRLGEDPAGARDDARDAVTVADLVDRFMAEEVAPTLKPRTARLYGQYFRNHAEGDIAGRLAPERRHDGNADIGRDRGSAVHDHDRGSRHSHQEDRGLGRRSAR